MLHYLIKSNIMTRINVEDCKIFEIIEIKELNQNKDE